MEIERRTFVRSILTGAAAAAFGNGSIAQERAIRWGYAAITWGGNDAQAIDDIAAVGFRGIQLRTSALGPYGDRPAALKELLAARGLAMPVFSSGNVRLDPALEQEDMATHTRHARFVREVGGVYLQVTDQRPSGRAPGADDYRRMGKLLTELGKRTADLGVGLVYHNHMNNLGEKPHEVRAVLDAADRRHVTLLFDTAHYQQGGGDPASAIEEYREWIQVFHIKDLESPAPDGKYRFVELGRGKVDFKGVFAAIARIGFNGWAVVELDRVPDQARTPKESAIINKTFLERAGFKI